MFKALTSGTQLPFPLFSYHFAGYKDVVEMLTTFWCKTYKDGEKRLEREREREREMKQSKSKLSHISFVYYFCPNFLKELSCSCTWKTIKILPQIKACDPHSHSEEDWVYVSVPVCLYREYSESSNEWVKFFKKERKKESRPLHTLCD